MRSYFPRLLGNDETKDRVGRAIESGRLPHAFLIGGPSGSGKSTLALQIAAAMNCEAKSLPAQEIPCGCCDNCRRIFEGNYPDLKILEKKKDKATLGVEAVKDFREDMFLSSTESEHKIYVIDDAECMTPEAQNALLKVLEEPPRSVTIILLAKECDRILTTIKSRALYIPMSRFSDGEIEKWLLSESSEARLMKASDESKLKGIIMSADGRLGLAKALVGKRLADNVEEERGEIIRLISAIGKKASYSEIYSAISRFPTKRAELSLSLERLMNALRDLIVIKYDKSAPTVFFASRDAAKELCGDIPEGRLVSIYDKVSDAHSLLYRNANVSNLLASLCAEIKTVCTR